MSATRCIQHSMRVFISFLAITQSRKAYISRRDASFSSFLSVHLSWNNSTFISYTSSTRPPHPSKMQYLTSLRLTYPTTLIVLGCLIILFHRLRHLCGRLAWRTQRQGSASSNATSTLLTTSSWALASTQTTLPSIPTSSLPHTAQPIYLAKNRTS
jgi:hypothetical protein